MFDFVVPGGEEEGGGRGKTLVVRSVSGCCVVD